MPYRDAIESVLQRCMELRARIQRIENARPELRTCEALAEALAWEADLRAHLDELEQRVADDEPIAPAVAQARPSARTYSPLRVAIYFALVLTAVVVFVVDFKR